MEERKGLAPLECLSTPYNLSKIAPRLAGLSPCVSFSIPVDTTGLFLLVSVLKITQRVISNLKKLQAIDYPRRLGFITLRV